MRPDSLLLSFVEAKAFHQVGIRQIKDAESHLRFATRRRRIAFASSQSTNFAFPALTIRSVCLRASSCQAGDSTLDSFCDKSAHSASMAISFSLRDIFLSWSFANMKTT